MSEWTPEMEEAVETYLYAEEQSRWLSDSEHGTISRMRAMLAEIRRLREELGKANAKAEQYKRDWYDAKSDFGDGLKRWRATGRIEGARAMQALASALALSRQSTSYPSGEFREGYEAAANDIFAEIATLKPEDV